MDPLSSTSVSGWLALVTGPYGGAFALGVMFGALTGIWLWQKYVVKPRIEVHVQICEERLDSLQQELKEVRAIADKWTRFMEDEAMRALHRNRDHDDYEHRDSQ